MGLLHRLVKPLSPLAPGQSRPEASTSAGSAPSDSAEPPAYDNDTPSTDVEPFCLQGQPYLETLLFRCPNYVPEYKVSMARREVYAQARVIPVTVSSPMSRYAGSEGNEPTLDVFIYLEIPSWELYDIYISAMYEPYIARSESDASMANPSDKQASIPKPWLVSAKLITEPGKGKGPTPAANELKAEYHFECNGRFTSAGLWRRGICATQNTLYGAAEPCLLGHQAVTICATSAYLGPCTVSYRIGVVHGKYAHGMAEHELHNSAIQWQPLSMPILFNGKSMDFVSGYIKAAKEVKSLTL